MAEHDATNDIDPAWPSPLSGSFDRSIIIINPQKVEGFGQHSAGDHEEPPLPHLLQFLPSGIPSECCPPGLGRDLSSSNEGWIVAESPSADRLPVDLVRAQNAIATALLARLRQWCQDNRATPEAVLALDSTIRVAAGVADVHPDGVIELFDQLEEVLKYVGDFTLVERCSSLVKAACMASSDRGLRVTERRTQATTRGIAWVYQRTGRLRDAMNVLDEDAEVNEKAQCVPGLASTLKARGRLKRVMAVRTDYSSTLDRQQRLKESLEDLTAARHLFQSLRNTDQVADVDALIARTYFVLGNQEQARQWAERSFILAQTMNKTYFDVLILRDEISNSDRATGETPGIDTVLEKTHGCESRNEIRARAAFTRARLRLSAGLDWESDADEAIAIYSALEERNSVAQVEWWRVSETVQLPAGVRNALQAEPPTIRIKALASYIDRYGQPLLATGANREREPDADQRWQACIDHARSEDYMEAGHRW